MSRTVLWFGGNLIGMSFDGAKNMAVGPVGRLRNTTIILIAMINFRDFHPRSQVFDDHFVGAVIRLD